MTRFFKIALVAAALAAPVVTVGVASADEGKASCCNQGDEQVLLRRVVREMRRLVLREDQVAT